MNFEQLSKPFPPGDVEWRAGATNQDKTQAMALAYITSRAVMNRLDEVVGPDNWQDEYKAAPSGGVMCGISIRVNGEWVTKWDVGENTDFEAIKGGFSDAFKRAAVKWGIGRYLYSVDAVWVRCEARGKSIVLKETPKLPAWAIPGVQPLQPAASAKAPVSPPAENTVPAEKQQASAEVKPRFTPTELRDKLHARAEKLTGKAGPEVKQAVAPTLEGILGGEDQRHEFIKWLTNGRFDTLSLLTDGELLALHEWLKPSYNRPAKVWLSTVPEAVAECTAAHREYLQANGAQGELL